MSEPIAFWTLLLIGVTCLGSWLGFRNRAVEEKHLFQPEAILAGKEYHRLVTSAFLHAGWYHLALNMVSLYLFGRWIELRFGPAQFLLTYFGSILGGSLLALYVHRYHEYSAYGASGGVCGIIFAYLLLFPGSSIYQFPIPFAIPGWVYAAAFIAASFVGMKGHNLGNIGHDAHLGGAIIGLLIAGALHPAIVRMNLGLFLLVLGVAVPVLLYLWFNPLFLPLLAWFSRGSRHARRARKTPAFRRETLEVDAILEKINRHGIDSLSAEEKKRLEQVSAKFQRRAQSKKPESGLAI
jgi:membrane associated rhomboid family serine protease